MKAMVYTEFGPPEVLHLKDVDKPAPKNNQVLIRIYAGSVTVEEPGMRESPGFNGFRKPRNPILGEEFAGEIESVGEGCTKFKVGDRVFGIDFYGAHAQFKCIAEDKALIQMPSNMSYKEAAAVPNGALTALPFLRDKGEIKQGDNVLINGASGSVGTAAVQIAKIFGADVTGVCSTTNIDMVKSLGAERVFDYTQMDFTQAGDTYDIIFDTVGKVPFSHCKSVLKENGIYLTTVPNMEVLFHIFKRSGRRVKFVAAGLRSASAKADDLIYIKDQIEAGRLISVIDRYYPLEELADAHRYVAKGHKKGNVVITVDHEN